MEHINDWESVAYRMRAEGFHYCFEHYSTFEEIEDEKFHELRLAFLKAANELENYVYSKL